MLCISHKKYKNIHKAEGEEVGQTNNSKGSLDLNHTREPGFCRYFFIPSDPT